MAEIGRPPHQTHRGLAGCELDPGLGGGGGVELGRECAQGPAVGLGDDRQLRSGGCEGRAVCEIERDVDTGFEADCQVARKASPDVEDPDDREAPRAEASRLDPGAIGILWLGLHRHLDHPGRRRVGRQRPGAGPVPDPGEEWIVAVREGARGNPQRQAASGLGGEFAAVDGRPDVLDHHSPPIAEQPVGDGVAHRIHARLEVMLKLADRTGFVMVPQHGGTTVRLSPTVTRYRLALATVAVLIVAAVLFTVVSSPPPASATGDQVEAVSDRSPAPDFTGIDGWLNSPPLTLADLKGKVVLIDFWTFSCVNCVRTIPHLKILYDDYKNDGFTIVGVHSPEFDFEKVPANVAAAVTRLGITWPVAIDSQMATWNAYQNEYWPAEYLLDQQGRIAYKSFGEGDYAQTDAAVAELLKVKTAALPASTPVPENTTSELYAGSDRQEPLADNEPWGTLGRPMVYPDPGPPQQQDAIQVTGTWTDEGEYMQADATGHVRLNFTADSVYIVAGTPGTALLVSVKLDGKTVSSANSGPALTDSAFTVTRQDLFQLLTGVSSGYHLIDLTVPAGFRIYTFTFG